MRRSRLRLMNATAIAFAMRAAISGSGLSKCTLTSRELRTGAIVSSPGRPPNRPFSTSSVFAASGLSLSFLKISSQLPPLSSVRGAATRLSCSITRCASVSLFSSSYCVCRKSMLS